MPQFLGESSKRLEILDAPFSSRKLPCVCVSSSKLLCELRYRLVALLFFCSFVTVPRWVVVSRAEAALDDEKEQLIKARKAS